MQERQEEMQERQESPKELSKDLQEMQEMNTRTMHQEIILSDRTSKKHLHDVGFFSLYRNKIYRLKDNQLRFII